MADAPTGTPVPLSAGAFYSFLTVTDSCRYDFLAPPRAADEIGRLGGYRALEVLGAGGMGVVFHAEDPALRAGGLALGLTALRQPAAAETLAGRHPRTRPRSVAGW